MRPHTIACAIEYGFNVDIARPNKDILVLRLSAQHSLDLVRLPETRRYRVVFAERAGVQKRAFIELSYAEAMTVAKFLASIENAPTLDPAVPLPIDMEETPPARPMPFRPPRGAPRRDDEG